MKPINSAIIGCGIAAKKLHWTALQKLKDKFEISVVCNHTEPKAQEFAELIGCDYVLDYRDVLSRKDVEAVLIALPIILNYRVTLDALRADKHVIVEKPLAANLTAAKKMLGFPDRFSRVMLLAENYRYRPLYQHVRNLLNSGIIGKVFSCTWNIYLHITQETNPYARTEWRIHPQHVGGFITDGGVHNIAVLRMFFGEPVYGFACATSINPEIGDLDYFDFHYMTDQEVNCNFQVCYSVDGLSENRLVILGEQGSLIVTNKEIVIKKRNHDDQVVLIEDDGGYQAEFEDFYDAVRNNSPVRSSFLEGFRDLYVLVTALKAAEKGGKVSFPLINP